MGQEKPQTDKQQTMANNTGAAEDNRRARANNTRAGANNFAAVLGYDHPDTFYDIKTNGSPPYDHPDGDLIMCPPGYCNEKLLLWVFIL